MIKIETIEIMGIKGMRNHKLDEWHTFCDWILTLPYMADFINGVYGGSDD